MLLEFAREAGLFSSPLSYVARKKGVHKLDTVDSKSVGVSPERLTRLTDWLHQQVSSERVAGCSVLFARRGKVAYFETSGQAEAETRRSFEEDSIVRIFSMTKPITTVAAMMLYEEGHFQLDDPVSKFIPSFSDMQVWQGADVADTRPATTQMTVKHLMTHTSGLTYGFMRTNAVDARYRELIEANESMTLEEWTEKVATIPLICEPGSQWNYSISTDVLGRLVEVWSGMSLEAFFSTRIFSPLGMSDSGFHVRDENHHRFTALYGPASGGGMENVGNPVGTNIDRKGGIKLQETSVKSRYLTPATYFSGGGGLTSTMHDYAQFCQMFLNGGELNGQRLLGRKTVEYMRQNHLPDNRDMAAMGQPVWSETTYDGIGFGLGGAVVLDPVTAQTITSKGEYHWGGAASTFFWIDPEEDLYVVFLTQLIPSSTYPIRRELRARIYQSLID
jgi:CubicO group peptidase (beta-lactamase class C family)